MNKTILDYEEATELADDDYIFLDSESGGPCKILAKILEPVITGIEATYTQSGEVTVDTPLNDLKADLTVKAILEDGSTKTVTDYTLSGTLAVGTSVVTVTYKNQTTTFEVEVTSDITYEYYWNFKESLVDKIKNRSAIIGGSATRSSDGVNISAASGYLRIMDNATATSEFLYAKEGHNLVLEVDIGNCVNAAGTGHKRLFMWDDDEGLIFRNNSHWEIYATSGGGWHNLTDVPQSVNLYDGNLFANSTIKFVMTYVYGGTNYFSIYKNDVLISKTNYWYSLNPYCFWLLGSPSGQSFYDITIEGARIYYEEV